MAGARALPNGPYGGVEHAGDAELQVTACLGRGLGGGDGRVEQAVEERARDEYGGGKSTSRTEPDHARGTRSRRRDSR